MTRTKTRSRGNRVARFIKCFGLIDPQHVKGTNDMLTERFAVRAEGRQIMKGKTVSMLLRERKASNPGRIPVVFREVSDEIEQAEVTMMAEDFRIILAKIEKGIDL